jgi:tetratricopeptide (TPR) repeat protein
MKSSISIYGSEQFSTELIISVIILGLIVLLALQIFKKKKIDGISTALIPFDENEHELVLFEEQLRAKKKRNSGDLDADEIEQAMANAGKYNAIPDIAKQKNDTGVEAFKNGELDKAISLYKEATEIAPHFNLAHYNLGNAFFTKNIFEKAIESYEKVIMLNPKDEFAYYNLAMSYYKIGQLKTSTVYYQKAIDLSPGDPSTHYNLGKAYEKLNDTDKAIEAYKKSISLKPDYANAHFNLAELLKFKGHNKHAIREYELYLKYNPHAEDEMNVKKTIVELMTK